jgi:hypothetical protein
MDPLAGANGRELDAWIRGQGLTALGFSYRLDPEEALRAFARLYAFLEERGHLAPAGGKLGRLYFSGLPAACDLVRERFPFIDGCFSGGEDQAEVLEIFGLPASLLPAGLSRSLAYDQARMRFGEGVAERFDLSSVQPVDRSGMPGFSGKGDGLVARLDWGRAAGFPPLLRAHAGPYLSDRGEAVRLFLDWTTRLARSGLLDVLSIGTSQLSQERFGQDWGGAPNGGGVPINSEEEYRAVRRAARPMLVRTYAGTSSVDTLARIHEECLDIAWHAFSLWWFSRLDGRGPNGLRENLLQHEAATRYAAACGKPVEPNVPHHFAFRGADDVTCVLAGYAAARFLRRAGLRVLVLQTMLNTPRGICGPQDLAKARALLILTREIPGLRVVLQPRAGLDYFSSDPVKARAQLAASAALMDDIEPEDASSPGLIHVVSYSEGYALADPAVIDESLGITRVALEEYRVLKAGGQAPWNRTVAEEVLARTERLLSRVREAIRAVESAIRDPWSAGGLELMFRAGFLPVPELAAERALYPEALRWPTALVDGGVETVDDEGRPAPLEERLGAAAQTARRLEGGNPIEP